MKYFWMVLLFCPAAIAQTTPTAPVTDATIGIVTSDTLANCKSTAIDTVCIYGTAAAPAIAISRSHAVFVPIQAAAPIATAAPVLSVNGKKPDASGNVAISATTITNATSSTNLQ